MTAIGGRGTRLSPRTAAGATILVAGAALLGAAYALTAFAASPFTLPAAALAAGAVAATVWRPQIGIAVAFVLVPIGNAGLVKVPLGTLGISDPPPWVLPSVWVVFVLLLVLARPSQDDGLEPPRLSLALGIYAAVALLATAVAAAPGTAAPILRSLATGILLFAAVTLAVRTRRDVVWVLGGIAAAAAIIGVYAAYQRATGYTGGQGFYTSSGELVYRATAGFPHPNQLGGFMAMLIPLIIAGAFIARRWRTFFLIAAALGLFGLYVSFSRASMVGLAVAPLLLLRDRRGLLIIPVLGVLLLTAAPNLVEERFATLSSGGSEFATRTDFWDTARFIWTQHPVVGVGLGGFPDAYADARVAGKEFLPTTIFQPPPDAHNIFLQLLAEEGLLGLLAFLALIFLAFRTAMWVARSDGWLGTLGTGLLATLIVVVVNDLFSVTLLEANGAVFLGVLGLLSAAFRIRAQDRVVAEGSVGSG